MTYVHNSAKAIVNVTVEVTVVGPFNQEITLQDAQRIAIERAVRGVEDAIGREPVAHSSARSMRVASAPKAIQVVLDCEER